MSLVEIDHASIISLEDSVSITGPSSVTSTMSSMRTPPMPGQVHARLDGDRVAHLQQVVVAAPHPRLLVDLEADAVAGAVEELVLVAVAPQHLADRLVDAPQATPGATASIPACCDSATAR